MPPPSTPKLPIFGMTSFLQSPLDIDDPDPGSDGDPSMVFAFGKYRPNFDSNPTGERRPAGYQKAHAQMQVADFGPTSVFVTVQTLTPGDGEDGVVLRGPTSVCPSFGWFHDLGSGAGIQGYLGQDLYAHSRWSDGFGTRVRGGVGVQYPIPCCTSEIGDSGWFFMLEARGYYRYDDVSDGMSWKVSPGVHWRANDACWLSVTASRYNIVSFLYRY